MLIDIRPIKSDADLEWALKEIEQYFDNEPELGSPESARFDILATLIEAYEAKHYPIDDPEPIPYLKSIMEMTGRTQADLAEVLGSRSRASEVLARKRYLSKAMINKLADAWKVTMDPLLKPYKLVATRTVVRPVKKPKQAASGASRGKRVAA